MYQQLVKTSVAEISDSKVVVTQNVLTKLLRLSQFSGGFYAEAGEKPIQVSNAKLNLLEEVLDDLGDQKVVIFARFLAEIKAIKGLLESRGTRYQFIDGSVPLSERGAVVEEFQKDPDCKVFIAQIQTAGLGITLHAANVAIFYSLDYSYANLDQAKARLHRIGQKNTVTYLYLITKGTVDEKIFKTLSKKEDVAKLIVDNWKILFEEEG
jgi:SNF2 family DNA or RNA helicase